MGSLPNPPSSPGLNNDTLLIAIPHPPDPNWIATQASRHPGLKIRWYETERTLGTPPKPLPTDTFDGVTLVCTNWPQLIPPFANPNIRFIQLSSAGADRWVDHPLYKDQNVMFCNASGVHAPQIAEYVVATYLQHTHQLLPYAFNQRLKSHSRRLLHLPVHDSPGLRAGILGYGAIGRHVARLVSALGMEVYAYTLRPRPTPESRRDNRTYLVPGTGDPDGVIPVKWFHGEEKESLKRFLEEGFDLLVLSLPLTKATESLLSTEQFDILATKGKGKTFIVNVGRGKLIDTQALLEAVRGGKIAGAALDVTDPEPLPEGHELLREERVFVTPHVSWVSPRVWGRVLEVLGRNLDALGGRGEWVNLLERGNHL